MFVAELKQRSVNVHVRVMMIGHVPLVNSAKLVVTGPQLSVAVTLAGTGTWPRHWRNWLVGTPKITGGVVSLIVMVWVLVADLLHAWVAIRERTMTIGQEPLVAKSVVTVAVPQLSRPTSR